MTLVMFDVDGTLTHSYRYDQQCYAETLFALTGLEVDTNWHNYPHVTDSAVTQTLIERHQLEPQLAQLAESEFARRLRAMHTTHPEQFQAMAGAKEILKLLQEKQVAVSIATGCWRDSALIKLEKSGITIGNTPIATASDALTRQEIMRESERRAANYYGVGSFERVIYVGDGAWDVRCSAELGYRFIGLGDQIDSLAQLGAAHTLADYSQPADFMNLLALQGLQIST